MSEVLDSNVLEPIINDKPVELESAVVNNKSDEKTEEAINLLKNFTPTGNRQQRRLQGRMYKKYVKKTFKDIIRKMEKIKALEDEQKKIESKSKK